MLVDSGTLHLLERGVRLASLWQVSLDAVFVEDETLLQVAALPFSREVVLHTGTVRKFSQERLRQEGDRDFARFQSLLAQAAARSPLHWQGRRHQGSRRELWYEIDDGGTLLLVGSGQGRRRAPRHRLMREALYTVYNGTASARRALDLAMKIAESEDAHLVILIPETPDYPALYGQATAQSEPMHDRVQLVPVHHPDSLPNLKVMVAGLRGSLVLLPRELEILDKNDLDELLQVTRLPVVLVH